MRDAAPPVNQLAPIANVALMIDLVETLRNRPPHLPFFGVFSGPAGFGKSTAATVAANEYDAAVIAIDSTYTTKHLFMTLAKELGLPAKGTAAQLSDAIAQDLALSERPLILDEADHLVRKKMIEDVRGLMEKCQAPLILIGEELLPQKLSVWERVASRVLKYVQAAPASEEDARILARVYAPGIHLDDDVYGALMKASGASTRRVSTNLYHLAEAAKRLGRKHLSAADVSHAELITGRPPAPRRALA